MKYIFNKNFLFFVALTTLTFTSFAFAEKKKKVTYRKTQEVNFEASDVDGVVRGPDGAFLMQKQGIKFAPLYKMNRQMDTNIKKSFEFLR
ncbi:MAG: hypothetical protein K1X29_10485 [Bdellovibrionales bacterium]|nr:hypothetical protein [Bdellovibrionales bacterium]